MVNMKDVDLHTHSNYSDGLLSPKELIEKAKANGIKHIALTDHNTIQGLKKAMDYGKKIGVDVIPGVEILSEWGEVLGYYIDLENKELLELLKRNQKEVDRGARSCLKELQNRGIDISYEEVQKKFPQYPMMCFFVAQVLVQKKIIKTTSELHEKFIDTKPELKLNLPKTEKVIRVVKQAGGAAILAHLFIEPSYLEEFLNMEQLIKAGLDGIEIENGQYKSYDENIKNNIIELSKKYNLIPTSGSDFHGDNVDSNLGEFLCDDKIINAIKERASSNNI